MRRLLFIFSIGCTMVLNAAPTCPILDLGGWQPQTASDTFTLGNLDLSSSESFSVVTRVTLPPTFAKWGAVFSLGNEATHQLTLTFSSDQGRAYLSGGGSPNALGGKTWYVPQSGFDATQAGGKTFSIALVNDVEQNEFALWINGKKQTLSSTKNGTGERVPALAVVADFPQLRLGNRIYSKNDTTQHFAGAVYDYIGIFKTALTEAQVEQLNSSESKGNAVLLEIIKNLEGTVSVTLTEDGIDWNPAWNGKTIVFSGKGTLRLTTPMAKMFPAATARTKTDFSPSALYLADGTELTIATPMGSSIVADTLWIGENVVLSADFTAPPTQSGSYAVLTSSAGVTPPLNGTVIYPEGSNLYYDKESALDGGNVSVAVIPQDDDGNYLLGSALDYEWYLTHCPQGASIRLIDDIILEEKAYTVAKDFPRPLLFDGDGHTLTLPMNASLSTTGNAALITPYPAFGTPEIRDLKVRVEGKISTTGTNTGAVVGFWGDSGAENLTLKNIAVEISSTATLESANTGSVGGIVGGLYKTKLTLENLRVDVASSATLTTRSTTSTRGVGGLLGGGNGTCSATSCLVVVGKAAMFSGGVGQGLLIGHRNSDIEAPALTNCAVVDFGVNADKLSVTASGVAGTPRLFCSKTSNLAETEGAILLETGTFSARDGATVPLLSGSETERLTLPETPPEEVVWAVEKTENVNTVHVTPSDTSDLNPGATRPLEYTFRALDDNLPDGVLWTASVNASCSPTMLSEDGYAELRSEADYAWYAAAEHDPCQKVRMAGDIELASGKTYEMRVGLTGTFDGGGHRLRIPADTTIGNTSEWSYGGCIASTLQPGALIKDVIVDCLGKVEATGQKSHSVGVIAGTTKWGGGVAASLQNVRVHLGNTASVSGSSTGGLVGEFGGQCINITAKDCKILDSGITIEKGAYNLPTGVALYKGNTVTTSYGGEVTGIYSLGEQKEIVEDGTLTLADAGLSVKAPTVGEGWEITQKENTVTITKGPGGKCSMTYQLEGFGDVTIPVTFTPMALSALPDGVTATPEQKALLMKVAAEAELPLPTKVEIRTTSPSPTLDALEVFDGILRADKAVGTLVVGYDFGVSEILPSKSEDGTSLFHVTATIKNDLGEPAMFAEGVAMNLLRVSDGASLLQTPVIPEKGTSEVVFSFSSENPSELFRVRVDK